MRPRRLALCLVAAAAVAAGAVAPAHAADGDGRPSLTDVHAEAGQVHGVLTVAGAGRSQGIDPGSVRVRFGSGPARPAQLTSVAREHRSALIIIDTSGSMAGAGLSAAKVAATTFLAEVPGDIAVGLASFADKPHVLVRPTTDRATVRQALGRLVAAGSTSLYDGVVRGVQVLGGSGSRSMVLLSDGADTVSTKGLSAATTALGASGIRSVVVGFRTGDTQNGVLRSLAAAGNGVFTKALDPGSLRTAFGAAAQDIAAQERVSVQIPSGTVGMQRLTVSGTVSGKPFKVLADVALPRGNTAAVAPATSTRAPAEGRNVLPWIAAIAVFLGLLVLLLAVSAHRLVPDAKRRIQDLDSYLTASGRHGDEQSEHALGGLSDGLAKVADAYIRNRPSAARTGLMLERADLPLRLNEWYSLRILAFPVCLFLLWLPLHGSGGGRLTAFVATVVIAGLLPAIVLRILAKRRARQFEMQLPDVLTLVATSLSTGFTLGQALDGITRDAADPAAKEFSRTLAQTRIGVDLDEALERTADRMDSVNLRWTTMAIRIQRRVGGDLAEVMRTTANTLRERESLRRQVRALSAEGRLSANILVGIPIVMALYLFFVNHKYIAVLWQRPVGLFVLIFSIVLLVVGRFWMHKITDVRV